MDRGIVYLGAIPREQDFLFPQRAAMIGLSQLAEAVIGRSSAVDGLMLAPVVPAALAINVTAGQIYAMAPVDSTAYGALPADQAHSILKQGVQLDALRLPVTPPGTAGFSQRYLVQCQFQEQEAGALVLPYYNAANPAQAWSGPGNSGTQQYTERNGRVVVQLKSGVPAATGSEAEPTADPGWIALGYVRVTAGQTQITAGDIVNYGSTPRLNFKLAQLSRMAGGTISIVRGSTTLGIESVGLVVVDVGAFSQPITINLPPASVLGSGTPARMTIIARNVTAQVSRPQRHARVVASGSDAFDFGPLIVSGGDTAELISDGVSRWYLISSKALTGTIAAVWNAKAIPNGVDTAVVWDNVADPTGSIWAPNGAPTSVLTCPYPHVRTRIYGQVTFEAASGGVRRGRFWYNNTQTSGGWGATQIPHAGADRVHFPIINSHFGMYQGDTISMYVTQTSGGALNLLPNDTWMVIEVAP